MGLATRIVSVVSERADCYARSFEAGRAVETASADTFADGIAVRVPVPEALAAIRAGAERIVRVSDEEMKAAMRAYFSDTHSSPRARPPSRRSSRTRRAAGGASRSSLRAATSTASSTPRCSPVDSGAPPARFGFERKQRPLSRKPGGVPGEAAVRSDDAVAGHDDRDRISPRCRARGARRARAAGAARKLSVADRLAVGHARDRSPDGALERGAARIERQVEPAPLAGKVFGELSFRAREDRACRRSPAASACRGAPAARKADFGQPSGARAKKHRAERAFERVVPVHTLPRLRRVRSVAALSCGRSGTRAPSPVPAAGRIAHREPSRTALRFPR